MTRPARGRTKKVRKLAEVVRHPAVTEKLRAYRGLCRGIMVAANDPSVRSTVVIHLIRDHNEAGIGYQIGGEDIAPVDLLGALEMLKLECLRRRDG